MAASACDACVPRVACADPPDVAQDRGQHQFPGAAHAGRPAGALGRHPLVAPGRPVQHLLLTRPDAGVGHPGLGPPASQRCRRSGSCCRRGLRAAMRRTRGVQHLCRISCTAGGRSRRRHAGVSGPSAASALQSMPPAAAWQLLARRASSPGDAQGQQWKYPPKGRRRQLRAVHVSAALGIAGTMHFPPSSNGSAIVQDQISAP